MYPIILAAVNTDKLLSTVIWLVVFGLIAWILWWFIDYVKLPEPFNKVAKVIVALVVVIVVIKMLIGFMGSSPW